MFKCGPGSVGQATSRYADETQKHLDTPRINGSTSSYLRDLSVSDEYAEMCRCVARDLARSMMVRQRLTRAAGINCHIRPALHSNRWDS